MKSKYIFLLIISGFIICFDQLTKLYIHTHFALGETKTVIFNFFNITYVRNFGAAFGFLADSHPDFREIFFLSTPPIALVIILLILKGVSDNDRLQIVALSSIFGGAIGNYIDRIQFRYVIDFLDFHHHTYYLKDVYDFNLGFTTLHLDKYKEFIWPAFNVADSAIVFGVSLLLYLMFLEHRAKKPAPQPGSKVDSATPN